VAVASTAILGIGNILQGDDGVGVRVVEALRHLEWPPDADLYDGGTAPFDMLDVFLEHERVVVIDCVRGGREPGTVYRLTPEVLKWVESESRFAHGLGVPDTVRIAQQLGATAEVVVLGVEPAVIEWSLDLSPAMEAAMPRLLDAVAAELESRADR
jgi:hydrogenase maturation protease